jgi:site-specific DNA recombinase
LKQALVEDENSIKKYFEMYAKADFDDEDTRNQVLEYFVGI